MGGPEIPITNPTAVLREGNDGWAVLVNMDSGAAVSLNPTGIAVWGLINGKHTIDKIVRVFTAKFHEVPETVQEDIWKLLTALKEDGFIGYEVKY